MSLLEAERISVRFGGVVALEEVSLTLVEGQIMGLIGPNGAGKTTLVDVLTGYARPAAGTVRLSGRSIDRLPAHRRARAGLRRTFQAAELFGDLSVEQNVAIGARDRATVEAVIERLGLSEVTAHQAEHLPTGIRRRVDLARALAAGPLVLLVDEPAAGLSEHEGAQLARDLRAVATELGVSVLVIEHDMDVIAQACDTVTVLRLGRVIACGPWEEIRVHPEVLEAYLGA